VRTSDLHKIVVLNSKGGCGKTTLATTLAAALAQRGRVPTLVDCDPHGFAMRWLQKRPKNRPPVHGLAAYGDAVAGGSLSERIRPDSDIAIIDLPGSIAHSDLYDFTYVANSVLIPIMPSEIDVFAASRLIADLLLDAQLDRRGGKLAIVANRVRAVTRSYRQLRSFLATLSIPMIAAFRDTQNFVHAAANGIGISELPAYAIRDDIAQVEAVLDWLNRQPAPGIDAPTLPGRPSQPETGLPGRDRLN
jgi:chromosome partitioning protein